MGRRVEGPGETDGPIGTTPGESGVRRRTLAVEVTADGMWAWVAWSDDGSGRCLHGQSMTAGQALQAAEHGAEVLRSGAEPTDAGAGAGDAGVRPRKGRSGACGSRVPLPCEIGPA